MLNQQIVQLNYYTVYFYIVLIYLKLTIHKMYLFTHTQTLSSKQNNKSRYKQLLINFYKFSHNLGWTSPL